LWYSPLGERGNRPIIKESGMDIEQAILAVRASRVDAVIEKAKAYAKANYNNGMDYFVECYADEQWQDYVHCYETKALKSWQEVKAEMMQDAKNHAEHAADVRGYSDCDIEESKTPECY
jgi:hypothetical protein